MPGASSVAGVSVADAPAALTVAGTGVTDPCAISVKVAVVNVATFIVVLKFATTVVLVATPVALASGETLVTAGAAAVVKVHV